MADVKEWGARFNFPENLQVEYGGYCGSISNEIAVKMAEQYDDFIVSQIAMEARAEGISDLTVLNKWAILNAIKKQIPEKVTTFYTQTLSAQCPSCKSRIESHASHKHCCYCGQALDWEEA